MWAAHSESGLCASRAGRSVDQKWRGFATAGAKELFRFGPAGSERICITEAAIDAMSLAAIEGPAPRHPLCQHRWRLVSGDG